MAHPCQTRSTSHTPKFVGLHRKESNLGRGVVIGIVDSGITPTHPSFANTGVPRPPQKWKVNSSFSKKIIGRQVFDDNSLVDEVGHGTHVSSIAAGNFVKGARLLDKEIGTVAGMAPYAHIVSYKVGHDENQTLNAFTVGDAILKAVDDGVHIINLSIGGKPRPFDTEPTAIAAYAAIQKGILVVATAGNDGPGRSTLANDAPWMLTVGASTIGRQLRVQLGNGCFYHGESCFQLEDFHNCSYPLVFLDYRSDLKKTNKLKGKIVLIESTSSDHVSEIVKEEGGVGIIIMNDKSHMYSTSATPHVLPASLVNYTDGLKIKKYIKSSASPVATIRFSGVIMGVGTPPEVASFSSRGPSKFCVGIVKPDIIAPGVNIIGADTDSGFEVLSGTSMACPHVTGIAAMLKISHPDWSPAVLKSAMMTTADSVNINGKPILDERKVPAGMFALGCGHVNYAKANDPGLCLISNLMITYQTCLTWVLRPTE